MGLDVQRRRKESEAATEKMKHLPLTRVLAYWRYREALRLFALLVLPEVTRYVLQIPQTCSTRVHLEAIPPLAASVYFLTFSLLLFLCICLWHQTKSLQSLWSATIMLRVLGFLIAPKIHHEPQVRGIKRTTRVNLILDYIWKQSHKRTSDTILQFYFYRKTAIGSWTQHNNWIKYMNRFMLLQRESGD